MTSHMTNFVNLPSKSRDMGVSETLAVALSHAFLYFIIIIIMFFLSQKKVPGKFVPKAS